MTQLKNRSELKFQPHALPKPVVFDYSGIPSDEDYESMEKAMPKEALEDEGVLISGERW